MAVSRSEREGLGSSPPREDTVPDAPVQGSAAEPPSGVAKLAKRLVAGDVVADKYVVERTLGMGGMGQVLAAKHVKLGTKVAIKVVHPELAIDPQTVARFLREAQAMAQLESPHIVRVHDVGELPGGVPYMIMEYLEGRDLGAMLAERGPLPVRLALEYVRQACDALAEAHASGIIHRDVKPQNLFVARNKTSGIESVRVLDFGLAKAVSGPQSDQQITHAGHVLGTAHYMAPEQLRAGTPIDARADVWGLGATLFRLLTRQYPFQETNAALAVAAILTRDPAPIESLRSDVPPPVAALVNRCLSKDPARRFQSVGELAYALDQTRMLMGSGAFVSPFMPQSSLGPAAPPFGPPTPAASFAPVRQPISARPPTSSPPSGPRLVGAPPQPPPATNASLYVSLALLAFLFLGAVGVGLAVIARRPTRVATTGIATATVAPPSASPAAPSASSSDKTSVHDDPP